MADLEIGDVGSDVKDLQKKINELYGKKVVPEDGKFDMATSEKLGELQYKLKLGSASGKADRATLAAIDDALIPRTLIEVKGKKAWVTQEQYYEIMTRASAKAAEVVSPYIKMANEFDILYTAHEKARSQNKIAAALVDLATGSDFPSPQIASNAKRAASDIDAAARSLSLDPSTLSRKSQPIRDALAAMDKYRDETFVGGEQLIRELKDIQDAAVVTLKILVAIKTGGASWGVQVSAAAGMGAYEGILGEVDKAGKAGTFDMKTSALNVLEAAAVDGMIALILKGKGKGGLEKVVDDAVEGAVKAAIKKGGKEFAPALTAYGKKAVASGAKNVLETALKQIPEMWRMDKPLKPGDVLDKLVDAFLTGLAMGALGELASELSDAKIAYTIKPKDVCAKAGVKNPSKEVEAAVQEFIKSNGPGLAVKYFEKLTPAKSQNTEAIKKDVMKDIVSSRGLKQAIEAAEKKGKK